MELITGGCDIPRQCGTFTFETPVSGHIPAPDGAEAGRLLTRSGAVHVDSLSSAEGSVTIEGRVVIRPIAAAGRSVFAFESSAPFRQTVPCVGATPAARAEGAARLTALRLSPSQNGYELAADVDAAGCVLASSPLISVNGIAGAPDAELLRREVEVSESAEAARAAFRLRDEVRADGVSRVHSWEAAAWVRSVNVTDGQAEVECALHVSILYENEDGELIQLSRQLPFTETLDVTADGELRAEVTAKPARATPYAGDIPIIALEADVSVALWADRRRTYQVTLDAYSPTLSFEAVTEPVSLRLKVASPSRRTTLTETLTLPDGMPAVSKPLYARATPVVTECAAEGGRLTVTGFLDTAVIYQAADGTLHGFDREAPFSETLDCPADANAATASVECLASAPVGDGGEVEVGYTLFIWASAYVAETLSVVSECVPCEPPAHRRGLVGYRAAAGETAFAVAKRFAVPVAALGTEKQVFESGDKLIFVV